MKISTDELANLMNSDPLLVRQRIMRGFSGGYSAFAIHKDEEAMICIALSPSSKYYIDRILPEVDVGGITVRVVALVATEGPRSPKPPKQK